MGVQMIERQQYNDEFKREALRLIEPRTRSVDQLADEVGVSTSQLHAWRHSGLLSALSTYF